MKKVGIVPDVRVKGSPRWVSVEERLPEPDRITLIWGSNFEDDDHPIAGYWAWCDLRKELHWIASEYGTQGDDCDAVERIVGTVTHWLDYGEGPD